MLLKEARALDHLTREARLAALKRELAAGETHQVEHEIDAFVELRGTPAERGTPERAVLAKQLMRAEIEALKRFAFDMNRGGFPRRVLCGSLPEGGCHMGNAYSTDLRKRVSGYVASGHSCRAAGRVFGASASTAVRVVAEFRATGSLAPQRQGRAPGTRGKLAPHILFLAEVVQAEPDITLRELPGAQSGTYGVTVGLSSLHRALVRAGLSYKKRPDRAGTRTR